METIYKKARAKVNLNLEITGKRENGYHTISSVFQKINLYDEIYIQKTKKQRIEIQSNIEELNDKENIIYKAYVVLKEKYKQITGVQVKLNKKIPMQAGLAGGSTDCASFIEGMNDLFDLKMSPKERESIGKSLGADVVPCFYRQAVKAKGIGEIIEPIHTNLKYYLVIIKPAIACSTKEMYEKIDKGKITRKKSNTDKIVQALEQGKTEEIASNLYNVFEEVMEEKELLQEIKSELLKQGALRKLNDRFRFLHLWNIWK